MRRLARRLFTFCSAVSLLVCVAVCVLWVRSYWDGDWWGKAEVDWVIDVSSLRGRIGFKTTTIEATQTPWRHSRASSGPSVETGAAGRLGFSGYYRLSLIRPPDPDGWLQLTLLTLPHWFLAVASSVLPVAFAAGRWGAARRHPAGLCPSCGYDRRASPERCPECGRATSKG